MATYKTEYVINFSTGEPFCIDVADSVLAGHLYNLNFHRQNYGNNSRARNPEVVMLEFELSLFASFMRVLDIGFETDADQLREIVTSIVLDFGGTKDFATKILADRDFTSRANQVFRGFFYDSSRAAMSMKWVYNTVLGYYSIDGLYMEIDVPG